MILRTLQKTVVSGWLIDSCISMDYGKSINGELPDESVENHMLHVLLKDGRFGFADSDGNIIIPCIYNLAWMFSEGLASVQDDIGKWGFIDTKGEIIIPCKYEFASFFSEGLAWVEDGSNKFGFIDKSGNIVIPFIYEKAGCFSKGIAEVKKESGEWGLIDKDGNDVVPFVYEGFNYKDISLKEGFAETENDELFTELVYDPDTGEFLPSDV